jgi:multidrug efflux pump subunit AcrA (membrane-fusion protein)
MSLANQQPVSVDPRVRGWTFGLAFLAVIATAGFLRSAWLPVVERLIDRSSIRGGSEFALATTAADGVHSHDSHEAHDAQNHPDHSAADSIEISDQARKTIGLELTKIALTTYTRSISVPGMIAERPGRSTVLVSAPMTGVIRKIYVIEGEAVELGQKLFDLRLTHEELVQSQADLLQTAEELDVIEREIKRIERLTENGGLAGKQLLERQYERQKLEAALRSKREALLLHGITAAQIDAILRHRKLLDELSVVVPNSMEDADRVSPKPQYQVHSLKATIGQHVNAGDSLITLADHAILYIQGEAFERDIPAISRALSEKATVTATLESEGRRIEQVTDLSILYLANTVDPSSRTLDFFVTLPNQFERDTQLPDGHRFIGWKFRPGQRVQIQVPLETLSGRIVLPIDAVVQDGVESYVFTPNGEHFDRRPVHVEFRDTQWAVIANDGAIHPGEMVAGSAAQQLQLALKNKAGGGIDPHAGHSH